jgi:hypothetical protein
VFLPHAVQPVGSVGDRELADRSAHPRVTRGEHDRVASARSAAAEDTDRIGVDVLAGLQVGDRVDEVLKLVRRREPAPNPR